MADRGTQAVLFDIDGTLITTGGASDRAWTRAFKELQDVDVDVPARRWGGSSSPTHWAGSRLRRRPTR